MIDEPSLDKPAEIPSESKPSSIIRWAVFLIAGTVLAFATNFLLKQTSEAWSVEKKALLLTTVSSQNLATTPEGLVGPLEFRLVLSPINKQEIKSLFSYQVSVQNLSSEAVENLTLHLYPPSDVKLVEPPRIICDSRILSDFVSKSERVLEKEIVFSLDLLGPGQRVMLAYAGYSEEAIADGSFIELEAQKKGWEVRKRSPRYDSWYDPKTEQVTVSHGIGYTDYAYSNDFQPYERGPLSALSKRIAEYSGSDVVALFLILVILICVSGLFGGLVWRVLFDFSKSDHLRSVLERLFRRTV